jgi:DNA mismatch repair ATPase MutS
MLDCLNVHLIKTAFKHSNNQTGLMQVDKTTLNDLAVFTHNEELSILHHIDFTRTTGGRDWLRHLLSRPLNNIKDINNAQRLVKRIISIYAQWPMHITNGTIMVLERFYDTPVDEMPSRANAVNAFSYKVLHGADFSLVKYSVQHFTEFIKGLYLLAQVLDDENNPPTLQVMVDRINLLLGKPELKAILQTNDPKTIALAEIIQRGYFFHRRFKDECFQLIETYNALDAYYSMATACLQFNFSFPLFVESDSPQLAATQLWHPLLKLPVSYNVTLEREQNFLFLTGANMAGKSTFIKAAGLAVYLAHVGMGVPAKTLQLSYFDGLLSNIQVEDNIIQGESYFFNEVKRIRKTIEKISDGKKWLILIDELFKGTNVQDAMKCSTAVIEGLLKMQNVLFVLSTHLYEIGEGLKKFPNIQFRYFETEVSNGQLLFSYQMKDGISNDRLGYLILKREGVVELLAKL